MSIKNEKFALKGHICYSPTPNHIEVLENGYVVCENGLCQGAYQTLPEAYKGIEVRDCKDQMIIPGLVDLHVHAPQYSFRGLGMDMGLLEWLETNTFPEESRYKDKVYAQKAYELFVQDLVKGPNTRSVIFATVHGETTEMLMDMLEATGLKTMVGKVNMDRNAPDILREVDAQASLEATRGWLNEIKGRYERTKPILTPRFIPSCTDELMKGLSELQKAYQLPLQSHLSENVDEIAWVQQLCPESSCYGDAYRRFDLFGGNCPTVMAHCVYSSDEEIQMMKDRGVYVAHCPQSNTNIASGIAPVRRYLDEGLKVGLGSDVAGGSQMSIFKAITDAIQVSKLRWRLVDQTCKPLSITQGLYMATKGGGSFFGKVGSFEQGYEFDALILDDSTLAHPQEMTIMQRLERFVYLSDERHLAGKYVAGRQISE